MDFNKVKAFAGDVTEKDLKLVDYYIGDKIGIFIPNGGIFEYATAIHSVPSYMFCTSAHSRSYISIDQRLYSMKPGELLTISPNVMHYEVPVDMQSRYYALFINPDYFEEQVKRYGGNIREYRGEHFILPTKLPSLIKEYVNEYERRRCGYEEICYSFENIIVHQIIRAVIGERTDKTDMNLRTEVEMAIDFMYQNMHHKILLSDIADDVQMSVSQFSKIFKDIIGTSPMEYLNDIRLERAKRLLLADDYTITKITNECGFSSTSYLASRFQKKYFTTPTEYRNRFKKPLDIDYKRL